MEIGVLREIKDRENRVALTPQGAALMREHGHPVRVERGAGLGSGFTDDDYRAVGATIVDAEEAWRSALVLKVKEPISSEFSHLDGQMVFTYFHLAGVDLALTDVLLERGVTAVAYETVEDVQGGLPLLKPMSAVAGHMAVTIAAYYLARFNGGSGVLLSKLLDRQHGKVLVIGDGVVGRHAAKAATALGAEVFICGRHADRLPALQQEISPTVNFVQSTPENIHEQARDADVVVGGVLSAGARAPHVMTEGAVADMRPGSVIVDVSIDQGGCIATSRPTSHSHPVYTEHDVIHYCVTNMPGAYPRTSTLALTSATLPYALKLADQGLDALREDPGFAKGVNTFRGKLTYRPVARALDLESVFVPFGELAASS